jgi:hypothetical protein
MTKGAAFLLALGISLAALLQGGIWEYGDGFLFNRFTGNVIYVRLPDSGDPLDRTNRLTLGREAPQAWFVSSRARHPGGAIEKRAPTGTLVGTRM